MNDSTNSQIPGPSTKKSLKTARPLRFTPAVLWMTLAGGVGGFLGFLIAGPLLGSHFDYSLTSKDSWLQMLMGQALLAMIEGAVVGLSLLVVDNATSLRGRWYRDLWRGAITFLALAFAGGLAGQLVLSLIGLSRTLPWAITGVSVGLGLGMIRSDKAQRFLGALGGGIGGFLSGLLVDGYLAASYTDDSFARASLYGVILTGALIGLFLRWMQDAMQESWLVGITTGPYQGKRYPLNTGKVTVGKSELCDISLYRQSELDMQSGAFENISGRWYWRGEAIPVNGTPQSHAALNPGDLLRLGGTDFRFQARSSRPESALQTESALQSGTIQAAMTTATGTATSAPMDTYPAPLSNSSAVSSHGEWVLVGSAQELVLPFDIASAAIEKTIGRGEDNDFVVSNASVSGHHALLRSDGNRLFITDLNSTNGTKVNGIPIAPQIPRELLESNEITLAESRLTVLRRQN